MTTIAWIGMTAAIFLLLGYALGIKVVQIVAERALEKSEANDLKEKMLVAKEKKVNYTWNKLDKMDHISDLYREMLAKVEMMNQDPNVTPLEAVAVLNARLSFIRTLKSLHNL